MAFKIPRVQTPDRLLSQVQTNISSAIEPLFSSLTGSFQIALSGCASTPAGIANWQRSTVGGPVCLHIPALTGTSNTAAATLTGLPTVLWPSDTQYVLAAIEDNGTVGSGLIVIDTDGSMTL